MRRACLNRESSASAWPQILLRAWIMVWMLAVPLFHVHPETDHHHGEAGHVHGGTVHTVFSPDLDGEFTRHHETAAAVEQPPADHIALSTHPSQASDYAELGFSFVSDSTDRSLPKPLAGVLFVVEPPAGLTLPPISPVSQDRTFSSSHTLFTRDIPSRAPPSQLV
ncbi:MAG: hypothetical protein RI101_04410 [Nitrospira sp.]|jgi:hypothetical protein|nr:hypothetical protein [Nitrospira sp.]